MDIQTVLSAVCINMYLTETWPSVHAKRRDEVVSSPASYSGYPGFDSKLGDRPS
jgi:hypothetical protein